MANDNENEREHSFPIGDFKYGPSIKKSLYYDLDDLSKLMNTIDRQNHLSILNINARCLVKHYLEFCSILQRIPFLFQIITVEETWLNDTLKPLIQMENYTFIPKHKLKCKEGGGLGIYI